MLAPCPLLDEYPKGSIVALEGLDQPTWEVNREILEALAKDLRDKEGYDLLLDVCGVDYPEREKRFDVVYHLTALASGERLRLKVAVTEEDPEVPSLTEIWNSANWFEREAFDMFGIRFKGHPNLRRILTHEAFQGHPLRKDYDSGRRWILDEEGIQKPHLNPPPLKEDDINERMIVNVGPSHPATHGTLRITAVLDGEEIVDSDLEIGYLHRCFEKMAETHNWQQVIPFTDRLNYCSSFINNVGYCRTVEKMLGVEAPPKAIWASTILSEFSRIMDHCVCNGSTFVDVGALTNFWYLFQPREEIYELLESVCGARLTVSACRIGGLIQDLPPGFEDHARRLLDSIPKFLDDVENLIARNRIWLDRAVGTAAITGEQALNWGWTGPCLRASGVAYDVRKAHPYDLYDEVDWEVPVLHGGDVHDRFRIRLMESRESLNIIRQLLDQGMPEGPHITDNPHVALPSKEDCYNEMESMIYHFKLIIDGIQVPAGERYGMVEGANGELGFYIVSDGSAHPYRIKVRPPCFPIFSTFPSLVLGETISDAVISLGGLNVIAGELDR